MRARAVLATTAALLSLVVGPARAGEPTPPSSGVIPGEMLLGVTPGTSTQALAADLGLGNVQQLPWADHVVLVRGVEADVTDRVRSARSHPAVRWAAPHLRVQTAVAPNDPLYRHQWNLGSRTRAPGAANWEPVHGGGPTGQGVTVAVIDTGVSANPDLDGVVSGRDFVDDDDDADDPQGHGTHVAGTIAQSVDNRTGVAGVAPDATVLAIRALDATGGGSYADMISSIGFAAAQGARVINVSASGDADAGICDAVGRAVSAGAVVVAAAGNEAATVGYPAACPGAIAVSATTVSATAASYTNTGPQIAVAAPGGDNSTDTDLDGAPDGILQYTTIDGRSGYFSLAGTSMAAPHVAGSAALLLEVAPSLSPAAVRGVLTSTAVDLGVPGDDPVYGSGLLDVAAAVTAAGAAAPPPSPPTAPPPPSAPPPPGSDPTPPPGAAPPPEPAPSPTTAPKPDVARLAGDDRFATAVAASRAAFEGGATTVYLASGRAFPDALATGALAGRRPGPLLLTEPCALPAPAQQELRRLTPREVVVIGGENAVCSAVLAQAAALAGAPVRRLAGVDRHATAAAIALDAWASAPTVFVASGESFPDSLPAGPTAAAADGPVLLVAACTVPTATRDALRRLRPSRIVIVGGQSAVCDTVPGELTSLTGATVSRIAGRDRFETSAKAALTIGPEAPAGVLVANGRTFPDGLAGGAFAAALGVPLVLVDACDPPRPVLAAVEDLGPGRILLVGGRQVVCDDVGAQLAEVAR